MPTRPGSIAQLGFVHAQAQRGVGWAKKAVKEWGGQHFGKLPERVKRPKVAVLVGIGKALRRGR